MSDYKDCESRGDCDEAYRERDELKHDIERHVAICTQQQTRIDELERELHGLARAIIDENERTCEPEGASCQLASTAEKMLARLSLNGRAAPGEG